MAQVIVYASKSGRAQAVAEKIAAQQSGALFSFKEMPTLGKDQEVIYVGSIYAGQILGLEKVASKLAQAAGVTLVTVGMLDPALPETAKLRQAAIAKSQSKGAFVLQAHVPLQGTLHLEKLSFPQRTLIKAMYKQGKKNPQGELGAIVAAVDNPTPFDWAQVDRLLATLAAN